MSAERLLAELDALGVRLSTSGDRLWVNAAAGQLSDELQARIRLHKLHLLPLVAARQARGDGEFPVSFAQRRLWFLERLGPGTAGYNLAAVRTIDAAVDIAAMEAAINDVRQHQGALRTVFGEVNGEPVQRVLPFVPMALAVIDLTALPPAQRDDQRRRATLAEATRPFDLATGPLFRAALLKLEARCFQLIFTLHHIVGDSWSLGIFLENLHAAYSARVAGQAPSLAPLTLQFAEHAARERAPLSGAPLETLLAYWRGRLATASSVLALPTDRPRPRERRLAGAALAFALGSTLSDALRALARSERATLYMTLLAIFRVLLFRYSGQADIVIGTPVANRHARELEHVVGMFVGTLPIRSDVAAGMSLRELIAQVRNDVIDAQAHAALPFERIVEELRPARHLAWSPIYQVVFALQNTPLASTFDVMTTGAMVDLSLFMWDEPGGIRGAFEYDTALFDESTVARMRDHFIALAASAIATPGQAVGQLPILSPAERAQLIDGWNATARPYPREAVLPELFDEVARRFPGAIAVETTAPDAEPLPVTQLTYAQLEGAASRLARHLHACGVHPGDAVCLNVERSVSAVLAMLAIVKAGAAYVPLDAGAPPARTREMLHEAGVRLVLSQRALAGRVQESGVRTVLLEDAWRGLDTAGDAAPLSGGRAEGPAYIMFTSGTTGTPKGVKVTHRNVARLVCNADYVELGPRESLLQLAPLAFDASTFEIWGALLNGARLVVHAGETATAAELARVLRRHRITTLWLTAGFFHQVVEYECQALAGVRQVIAGGDVLSASHVQRLLDAKRDGAVINGYGPTENTTFTCCHRMSPGLALTDTVPIGRPIANTRVYVLDEFGAPVPPGVIGELFAAGDGVADGYVGTAAADAGRFLPDPFVAREGATMYRTGDLVHRRPDGVLEFVGRRDNQVKVRGFRVELEEVEEALRACEGVREAVVLARRDASGANDLAGYFVPRGARSAEVADVRQALRERLPAYMVPAHLVTVQALPLTPSGKVDRHALPEPRVPTAPTSTEPRSQVEAQLHAIWASVLGRDEIGLNDDFFALGGHSLLAVRLFAQIERVLGVQLPLSALFLAPTIAGLAMRLQGEGFASAWSSLVAIKVEGTRRPLFLVPGVGGNVVCFGGLARLLDRNLPVYALQSRGLDRRQEPFGRIEPMAAHYISEIRTVQPHGPYRFGGSCFGGVVAYEMAQQLRAAGEIVEMLFLLETWPPRRPRPVVDALCAVGYSGAALRRKLSVLRTLPRDRVFRTIWSDLTGMADRLRTRLLQGDGHTIDVDPVSLANRRALLHYEPRPYDGVLRCAVAAQRPFVGKDERLHWRTLAPRDHAHADLPAVHAGALLQPPSVAPLAAWISEALDALDNRPGPTLPAARSAAQPDQASASPTRPGWS